MTTDTATSDAAPVEASPASPSPTTAPAKPASEASAGSGFATKLKHVLLKIIDVTALGFLEPIVRLCYGEEPSVQVKKIGRFIVLPALACVLFLFIWLVTAPNLKTKYGALPTPGEVYAGWSSTMTFHDREMLKSQAYVAEGDERLAILSAAQSRVGQLEAESKAAAAAVTAARAEEKEYKDKLLAPLRTQEDEIKAATREQKAARKQALKDQSAAATTAAAREQVVADIAAFSGWEAEQRTRLNAVKDQIKAIENEKYRPVVLALLHQTQIDEEKQFANKLIEIAGEKSREEKLAALHAKIAEDRTELIDAEGAAVYKLANSINRSEGKIDGLAASTYARPWTLPMQIVRSILTVFSGFLIGVALAIPAGILCGLSPTFMAMLTPFIALFKPVSPIVWLLIFWIIVGGIFPDPDNSTGLAALNAIGNAVVAVIPGAGAIIADIDINPAFIACAMTVAMCSLWATMVNTALGVASVDKDHINVAKVLRLSMFDQLRKIVLPSALPLMFAGMRISLGIGWMVLIAAELIASSEGLGKYTNDMFQNGNTDSFAKIMVMVFVVGAIGLVLDRIMIVFQRLVSFEGSVAAV